MSDAGASRDAGGAEVVTVIAVFDTDEDANQATQRLRSAGVPQENISQISGRTSGQGMRGGQGGGRAAGGQTGGQATAGGQQAGGGGAGGDMTDNAAVALIELGIPDEDADLIIGTLDDGSVVIAVTDVEGDAVAMVINALDTDDAMDLNARQQGDRAQSGQERRTRLQSQAGGGGQPRQLGRRQDESMRVRTYSDRQAMGAGASDVDVQDRRAQGQAGQTGTDKRS